MPQLLPEELALTAGRPILVSPLSWSPTRIGKRILVAWNARREATRAVNDALPLLNKAESVTVLVVNPEKWLMAPHGEEPGADIALHLAHHGVTVQVAVTMSLQGVERAFFGYLGLWDRRRYDSALGGGRLLAVRS